MTERLEALTRQVAELQTQQAFQEDTIASLDEALSLQQLELIELRRIVVLLREQLVAQQEAASQASPGAELAAEKPPHY